jgi:hypothetical protein
MDIKWDATLKDYQRSNPVVYSQDYILPHTIIEPSDAVLNEIFKKGETLKTWGRSKKDGKTVVRNDPHFIACSKNTPLHVDPRYPRYSHHLKIRVDSEIYARGIDKVAMKLNRGTFYILDTHSPHQIFQNKEVSTDRTSWNVACSLDSDDILDTSIVPRMMKYLQETDILESYYEDISNSN